jgi:hypothetical protein
MARKRKQSRRKSSHRRRKVGAIGSGMASALQMIAGGVAAQFAGKLVDRLPFVKDQSEKTKGLIKGALPIALGMYLPKLIKGSGQIGAGMVVGGGIKLVQSVVPQIGAVGMDYYANKPTPIISGYQTATPGNYIAGYQTATPGNYIAGLNKVAAIIEAADQ